MTRVIHANWSDGRLHLWVEGPLDPHTQPSLAPDAQHAGAAHPFTPQPDDLSAVVEGAATSAQRATLRVCLPSLNGRPLASSTLARASGHPWLGEITDDAPPVITPFDVPTFAVSASDAPRVLARLLDLTDTQTTALGSVELGAGEEPAPSEVDEFGRETDEPGEEDRASDTGHAATALAGEQGEWRAGQSLEYFAHAARLARHLMVQQRFLPSLTQTASGDLRGAWHAWLSDESTAHRIGSLARACPASARCVEDQFRHDAGAITEAFVHAVVDATCRAALTAESFADAVSERNPDADPHVAWLRGLLGLEDALPAKGAMRQEIIKRVRGWIGVLEERGASSSWRLLMRLLEPDPLLFGMGDEPEPTAPVWRVTFHLQAIEQPALVIDASEVWLMSGDSATIMGRRIDRPQELLLSELGRASRFFKRLEEALDESEPVHLALNTKQAYEFLREHRMVLIEQGFAVQAPDWWESPAARLGAKLRLESDATNPFDRTRGGLTNAARAQLGLSALIKYQWEIAVGDTILSLSEFEKLAAKRTPLVRVNGRWVEIRPEDVHAAVRFIRENPGGSVRLGEALRMAYGVDLKDSGIPVVGLEATGWLAAFLNSESASKQLEALPPPATFRGTLRPYQQRGLSWMAFQEQLGFGICLADDMGLGKTVQLLALLAWEREIGGEPAADTPAAAAPEVPATQTTTPTMGELAGTEPSVVVHTGEAAPAGASAGELAGVLPTLLLVPMSVVGNWIHETQRFCPHLRLLVHHGPQRLQAEVFAARAASSDLVVTTYSLAHRDKETLARVKWGRVVLDEAQYIKNPTAKQSQAVRSLDALQRVALTGTPVENRLTELWSIMDFLNPGYLGSANGFRQRFAVPIERYHDKQRGEQLRGLVRPFILRRLKSDPSVVADLPEKVESKEYGYLTSEQANMYESIVKRMLTEVDEVDGMQRRGLVLSTLVRLKQVCDHPVLVKNMGEDVGPRATDPARSGKCIRLLEMLDEAIAEGDQALVFTQFREMGKLLEAMISQRFNRDVLFIHGGTTQPQRQAIIDRFQKSDGTSPVLILSLRAGGVGLNLTAATHVFHFDRWWNPAVENQATDRAYRIGQTRTVQVHKFVVRGTLEERIDQMIESKTELAENIIGSGEQWLSELNTDQLRDILTLRNDAVDDEVLV
ncbi:MAG: DEAD/DEAH box helicase [Phycisphaeraceae bacterium]|nr:DEAD/DEAH box helicase [Phycisphaeraceae bacterium]